MRRAVLVLVGCWAVCSFLAMAAIQPPPPNIYRLKVEIEGNGTVTPDPAGDLSGDVYFYITQNTNFIVDVEACPDTGWTFDHWEIGPGIPPSGTAEYTDNPHSITFTPESPDWTAKAVFTSTAVYAVTVNAVPPEGGTVTGGGEYPEGTQVTVTANPNPCYEFVNWTEDGTVVSTEPFYTFTVETSSLTLSYSPTPSPPAPALGGRSPLPGRWRWTAAAASPSPSRQTRAMRSRTWWWTGRQWGPFPVIRLRT